MKKSKASVPAVKPRRGGAAEKIVLEKALELRLKGVTFQDIATFFGCSKAAVIQRLRPYVATADIDTELYVKNRADILANRQISVLAGMTPDKLEKAGAKDLAVTFGILYDKERLERGQSTQNIAQIWASAVIEAEKIRMGVAEETEAIGGDPGNVVDVEAEEIGEPRERN